MTSQPDSVMVVAVSVNDSVVASFTAEPDSGSAPLEVRFTNESEHGDRFEWSFGTEVMSEERDPTYVYAEPGSYEVVLRVYGAADQVDSTSHVVTVTGIDLSVDALGWVDDLEVELEGIDEGDSVGFVVAVTNLGDGVAEEYRLEVLVDGDAIYSEDGLRLTPGGSSTHTTKLWTAVWGDHVVKVQVVLTDGSEDTDETNNVKVDTFSVNGIPVADAGSDIEVLVGAEVTLDGSGSEDRDGDELDYHWVWVSGPSVTLEDPTQAQIRFTPEEEGEYVFSLTVSDGKVTSQPDSVMVVAVGVDLSVAAVSLVDNSEAVVDDIHQGDRVAVEIAVKNLGRAVLEGYHLEVSIDDTVFYSEVGLRLASGDSHTHVTGLWTAVWGDHVVKVQVVPGAGSVDLDETNNMREHLFAVDLYKVLFVSDREGSPRLYLVNADGSDLKWLSMDFSQAIEPQASPDGRRIAFTSFRDGQISLVGSPLGEIYVMDMDGGNLVNLSNHPDDDREPSWSPDGTRIAFSGKREGDSEIFLMDLDGSNVVNITENPGSDRQPSWSPDGTQVAFTSVRENASGALQAGEIYVVGTDRGSIGVNLTQNPAEEGQPSWSPDGSRIAFVSGRDGDDEIYVINADGSDPINLSRSPGSIDWRPMWSSDGTRIAFISDRDGIPEIYLMDADGSNQVKLVEDSGSADWPSWVANR